MKDLIRFEEAMMLMLAAYLKTNLPYEWWLYWALFLAPDIGIAGYAINARVGAFTYNLLHHKGVAVILFLAGVYFTSDSLQFVGLLLFGHSSFDRMLGYGLKYPDSFKNTHLGLIGQKAN
jgi:hypothetical protein